MARPRNSDRDEPIRDTIAVRAAELFAEHGYHGASLSEIARAADIKAPSLLYHFGSKEGLYTDVVRRFYRRLMARWQQRLVEQAAPRVELLVSMLGSLRELETGDRRLLVTIITELLRDGRAAEVIEEAVVPVLDGLVAALDPGASDRGPTRQTVALLMIASVMSLDAGQSMPAVDRLRAAMWGHEDHLDELAARLLGRR